MQYDINPIFLSSMERLRSLVPLLSLGKDTARLNPKLSTSPMARKINLVGGSTEIRCTYTNKQEPRNQRDKGVVNPFTETCESEI